MQHIGEFKGGMGTALPGTCSDCRAQSAAWVAGGLDGSMQVWSIEGRCLDSFDGVADQVPPCTMPHWLSAWRARTSRPADHWLPKTLSKHKHGGTPFGFR